MATFKGMKILAIDIETSPSLVYTWGLFKQNIGLSQVVEPTSMMCWAAEWQHKKGVIYRDERDDDHLSKLWALLDETDAVLHYNGKNFDIKHIQREFLLAGLLPPTPFAQIDLLNTVRGQFRFTSNKLEHVVEQLGIGTKIKTDFDLWVGCMKGDPESWAKMKKYNKMDVTLLWGVYDVMLPWIKQHPNIALYLPDDYRPTCPSCGSKHVTRKGIRRTKTLTYRRYQCQDCGTHATDRNRRKPAADGVLKKC